MPPMSSTRSVLRVITRLNVGGPTRHVAMLMQGLPADAYTQLLVHGPEDPVEGSLPVPGERALVPALARAIRPWSDRTALRDVRRIVERVRPDVVHTHQGKAGALGRLAAGREGVSAIVHTYHGHTFRGYFGPLKGALVRAVERRAARASHALICQSVSQEADVVRFLGALAEGKTRIIPPAVDATAFVPASGDRERVRASFGVGEETRVLLLPARLAPVKEPERALDLVEALRTSTDVRLWIAGDGPLRDVMAAEVKRRELRDVVALLGNRTDLPALYAGADLTILTSREEGTPLALLESWAAGTAVAATAVGGVADLISGVGTLLDPLTGPCAWAPTVRDLLADDASRQQAAEAGRVRVRERHAPERLCGDVSALYRELLR